MGGCSAPLCSNSSQNRNPAKNRRMFKFPKDSKQRQIWAINCRRYAWSPGKYAALCEDHFTPDQFEQCRQDGWKKLKPFAIPTIFNASSNGQKKMIDVSKMYSPGYDSKCSPCAGLEILPKIVKVSSNGDEFSKLQFDKNFTDRNESKKLSSINMVSSVQRPILSSISVPLLSANVPISLSADTQNKKEETLLEDNKVDNIENDSLFNGDSNIQHVTAEMCFNYTELKKCLEQIHKPNSWWTISHCKDFIICAKWDAGRCCQRRVVICEDLTVEVYVENTKVLLDSKINSYNSVSSLLQIVDEL